jgi:hypothetical protein
VAPTNAAVVALPIIVIFAAALLGGHPDGDPRCSHRPGPEVASRVAHLLHFNRRVAPGRNRAPATSILINKEASWGTGAHLPAELGCNYMKYQSLVRGVVVAVLTMVFAIGAKALVRETTSSTPS